MSGIRNIQNNQINQKMKEMQQSDNKLTRAVARYLINQQKDSSLNKPHQSHN